MLKSSVLRTEAVALPWPSHVHWFIRLLAAGLAITAYNLVILYAS